MPFEPIGPYVLLHPTPLPKGQGKLWHPEGSHAAREATVIQGEGFRPGERLLVPLRQVMQVGDDWLVPSGAILARLS